MRALAIRRGMFSSPANRLSLISRHLASMPNARDVVFLFVRQGAKFSPEYVQYATVNDKIVSYIHDVPLSPDFQKNEVNMVLEIPRWSQAKFEILMSQKGNPITQDQKNGAVRFVKNLFPYHGYIQNYGALPQTWEDPTTRDEELLHCGDNDPVDVCEIGSAVMSTGDVTRVRVLGCLAMIDEGEVDWKVIAIRINDPLAEKMFCLNDVNRLCPGLLTSTRQWFRDYKLPDGKPRNTFGFNGEYQDAARAMKVISECHSNWNRLVRGQVQGAALPSIDNVTLPNSPGHCRDLDISVDDNFMPDKPLPMELSRNFYF